MKFSTLTIGAKTGEKEINTMAIKEYVSKQDVHTMFVSLPSKPRIEKRNPDLKLKQFKNQITIGFPEKVDDIIKNVKVKFFSNGSLHITGCNTMELVHKTIDKTVDVLNVSNNMNILSKNVYLSVDIFMVNKVFEAGYKINQRVLTSILTDKYNIMSIFNPKEYAGIKAVYYTNEKKVSFLIFQSGKITVAGAKDVQTLIKGYEKIRNILIEERSLVQITEV